MATSSSDIGNVVKCFMDAYIVPGTNVGPSFQPCIHTVCRNCLGTNKPQEYRRREGERLKCQTCYFEADYVPDVKCYQRPDDFIRDLIDLSIEAFGTNFCCEDDRQHSSSHRYYCLQCDKLLCFICRGKHSGPRHTVSDSHSHISKMSFAYSSVCFLHKKQLEICCVDCRNALCIVCFLENDETVFDMVNSDYISVQHDTSTLKKGLSERKEILDTEIQKINTEPDRIERKIDERTKQLKNHLEMCSKKLKNTIKVIQEEEKSRLKSEVQSVEQNLKVITNFNSFGPGSLQGKDIVRYLSKWTGLRDLQRQCNEMFQQCPKKSQLRFVPASNSDPFNEDVIGTLQGIESTASQDAGKDDSHKEEFSDDVTKRQNLQESSLPSANNRLMDAASTFQSVTGTSHKDENGLIKILTALNEHFKVATETRQQIEEVISRGSSSYGNNDKFAAIRSILNKNCENELKATQNLLDTMTSIHKEPTGSPSKYDQLDKFKKILERRNEEFKKETSIGLNKNRDQRLQPRSQVSTLANLGNTCFLNVIIQVLCHTNIFVKLLSKGFQTAEENRRVKGDSITALVKLFTSMLSEDDQRQHHPTELYVSLQDKFKKFTDLNQHDCHDLMIHLLNRIRQEEREALGITSKHQNHAGNVKDCIPRKSLTVVDEVFGGHIFTAYICTECFQPYHLCEPFLALSLPIYERQASHTVYDTDGFNNSNTGGLLQDGTPYQRAVVQALKPFDGSDVTVNGELKNTLFSSLEHFTRFEYMIDEYLCRKCNAKSKDNEQNMTSAAKRTLIYNPPAILTIHLKRFQQESMGMGFVKNDEHIQFNYHLDIAPFCSSGCLNVDPSMKNIWYMLYGVVVHWGNLRSGHYLIYVRVREDEPGMKDFLQKEFLDHDSRFGERELIERMRKLSGIGTRNTVKPSRKLGIWYRISDGQCDVVQSYSGTADEVLRQNAYMLFYERMSTTP